MPPQVKKDLLPSIKKQIEVDGHLGAIASTLTLSGGAADPAALARVNRRYGDQLGRIGIAGAAMVDRCAGPFKCVATAPGELRDEITRLSELEEAEAAVEGTRQRIRQEINLLRVKIGGTVTELHEVCQFTLAHPGWQKDEQEQLGTASQAFRGAIKGREDEIAASSVATRNKNEALASERKEQEAANSRLAIENKFLSGTQLRPTDLDASAMAAAPRATAAAPKATRRRAPRRKAPRP